MPAHRIRLGAAATLTLASACSCAPTPWPHPAVPAIAAAPRTFAAGVASVDITPPPGLGLTGNGPEGARATGWRVRLRARALVLADTLGERVALVQVDLPMTSIHLHRRVSAYLTERDLPYTPDRIVLTATHTHSAPGHFHDAGAYNEQGSSVPGFDTTFAELVAKRIARAIAQADSNLTPVEMRRVALPVWGLARNRSVLPFLENEPVYQPPFPPPDTLEPPYRYIDPTLTVVRFDRPGATARAPVAVLFSHPFHATGNMPANDLYDADIPGLAAMLVDARLDSSASPATRAVFLSSALGDVSPSWNDSSRCRPPRLWPVRREGGPRTLDESQWQNVSRSQAATCIRHARREVASIAEALAAHVIAALDSIDPVRTPAIEEPTIHRAFAVVPLAGPGALDGLCAEAAPGTATVAGAEDAPTRYANWRLFGVLQSGFEEGGSAAHRRPKGCHGFKKVGLGLTVSRIVINRRPFPEVAQFAVVRVGPLALATVPAEVTTTAAHRMRLAVSDALDSAGVTQVLILSHTNGFLQYVATREEYALQHYEGSSTLYGPGEATAFTSVLASLAAAVARNDSVRADAVVIHPGRISRVLARSGTTPRPTPHDGRLVCTGDTLVARWRAPAPIATWPADGPTVQFSGEGLEHNVIDDDPSVTVRVRGTDRRARWEARWIVSESGSYRVTLMRVAGAPGLGPVSCGEPRRRSAR